MHALDHDFIKPNGCQLSPDERTLYVSDTGYFDGEGGHDESRPRCIYAFDLEMVDRGPDSPAADEAVGLGRSGECEFCAREGHGCSLSARNRRQIYELDEHDHGIPDGLKCDEEGRLYAGCADGVHVLSPAGELLGKLLVDGGVANLCFGGVDGQTLCMLNERRALAVDLSVSGALS